MLQPRQPVARSCKGVVAATLRPLLSVRSTGSDRGAKLIGRHGRLPRSTAAVAFARSLRRNTRQKCAAIAWSSYDDTSMKCLRARFGRALLFGSGQPMRRQCSTALFGAAVAGLLVSCAPSAMGPVTMFADPGKYVYHNCEQLAAIRKEAVEREQNLKLLMDKAEESTGGAVVNVIAYQAEYTTAREEVKVIDATWNAKKCK